MRALVAAATALALTACGSTGSSDTSKSTSTASAASTSSGSEADTENEITIPAGESVSQDSDVTAMVAVDFTTMDPMDTSDTLSGGVQRMMMDGLFGFDENMQIIPMLATSYEANDEATEYTIHLREGVSFTDGTPWNADALIANVNKWADKSLGLKRTTFLCNVLDHAEKIDDYTVKIYLTQSFGAFISNLAHPATLIMSPKQIEAGEDACAQAPVGTGQYKFVEWVAGDHMKVELNKDWWGYDADVCGGTALADADAGFKSITFKPVAESATRVSAVQAGDAQIMWSVPTESVDTLKGDSNVSVGMGDSIAVWYFFMNTQKAPFNDVKVREAMAYAINKEAYIQVVMNGYGSVATSMVGEEVQHYKGNDPYSYDPEKAKEMQDLIYKIKGEGDTIGGVLTCVIKGCPIGLGQPVFGKLHAALGNAMLSINAAKAFEYGDGFKGLKQKGSEQNDVFYNHNGRIETRTNHSGGIQGGISNGQDIFFRVAFKPVATVLMEQETVNIDGIDTTLKARGRHDPCVLPRAVPIVEAMAAMTILDYYLLDRMTQI